MVLFVVVDHLQRKLMKLLRRLGKTNRQGIVKELNIFH